MMIWFLNAYYSQLIEYERFQADMRHLSRDIGPYIETVQAQPSLSLEAQIQMVWNEPRIGDPVERHIHRYAGDLPQEGRHLLETASARWGLPRRVGFVDLLYSFQFHWNGARLLLCSSRLIVPLAGMAQLAVGRIHPNLPIPFLYTAGGEKQRKAVRQIARDAAEQVEQSILAQAREIERQGEALGWGPPAPKYLNITEVPRLAQRLFRSRILRWSNARILKQEADEDPDGAPGTPQAISGSVNKLIRLLDLSPMQRPK